MSAILVWVIAAAAIAGIMFRPKHWPEAVWACAAAVLLVVLGILSPSGAAAAAAKGTDVYLFLFGMMLLAELARQEGVFDWLAALAVDASNGSKVRLFTLIYLVGVAVTTFLSNDATAVVLTPAVAAAVKRARAARLPYLFTCAFIANAASFVLPISNPANLVLYSSNLPPLATWLRTFLLPSIASIVVTYLVLRYLSKSDLEGKMEGDTAAAILSANGKRTLYGIAITAAVLITASAMGVKLGLPTAVVAIAAVCIGVRGKLRELWHVSKGVAWSVLPLVAGLFVIVDALDAAGALRQAGQFFAWCAAQRSVAAGPLAASFGVAAASNIMNNLPAGLLAAGALRAYHTPALIRDAVLVGVDLGPNLSVTGSLATILWLIALRRDGEGVTARRFVKTGLLVMPPALLLATLALLVRF